MSSRKRVLFMNILQILKSPMTYISIVGVVGICYISAQPYIADPETDIFYIFELFIGLSMSKKLITLFAGLAYTASFCNDWNYQYIKPIIIRSGINKYTTSKVITCFLTAFLTSFIGMFAFALILSFKYPLMPSGNISNLVYPPYKELALSWFPASYLIAKITIFSMAAATWSISGLAISAYIPNSFVALSTPIISSYILETFTDFLPKYFNLYAITASSNILNQGALISFLYFIGVFFLFSLIFGWVFIRQVRRRIRSEVV